MTSILHIQGRSLSGADLDLIRNLLADHPEWCRSRLSVELCELWDWRNTQGRIKDMAARTLLLKLERAGHIVLPPRRGPSPNENRNRIVPTVAHATEPIVGTLRDLQPLVLSVVKPGSDDLALFKSLLSQHHYLGHKNTVGENLQYLVRDTQGRPVACSLFGSAAWRCSVRDDYIGWAPESRRRNLQRLTNNTRYLVLPWVKIPHLASHVLGLISRQIRADWQAKYGHTVEALETFVDRDRFRGTCYLAANWLRLGATQGRTRNDREHRITASIKDVYIYPLSKRFRLELCS